MRIRCFGPSEQQDSTAKVKNSSEIAERATVIHYSYSVQSYYGRAASREWAPPKLVGAKQAAVNNSVTFHLSTDSGEGPILLNSKKGTPVSKLYSNNQHASHPLRITIPKRRWRLRKAFRRIRVFGSINEFSEDVCFIETRLSIRLTLNQERVLLPRGRVNHSHTT